MRQPERLISLVGIAGLSLVCIGARAQSDQEVLAAARACMAIADDGQRLNCLDEALGLGTGPVGPGPSVTASVGEREPVSTDRDPGDVNASVATGGDSEALSVVEADEPERTVRIVEIRRSGLGETTFVDQGGQAWVQRSGSAGRFPAVPFDAVVRPAMGDSYFLVSAVGSSRARVVPVR